MRRLAPFVLAAALSFGSLSCVGTTAPPLSMHVDWGLDGPAGMIPAGVTQLNVLVYVEGTSEPQMSIRTVAGLTDMDGNGRMELVRQDLPTGVPIRMVIEGQDAGRNVLFVGHAGPFTLLAGERRYVDLRMYAAGSYTQPEAGILTARMLATSTLLPDGRVLITGGFTRSAPMACPADLAGATCFDLTAGSDAYLFDPASGRFYAVQGGLRQARGGHTATALPGGRVLVAGGSAHAVLALVPTGATNSYAPVIEPLDTAGPAPSSFEIFLPDANAEVEDTNRDGDPGRGGFVGAADDPTSLGRLDAPRFLHAAAAVPGHATQVLLAGGLDSPDSWVVYDDARAGGYGVLDASSNRLKASRPMPSIVPVRGMGGDGLYILGGGDASSIADVAEVWLPSATAPSGATTAVTASFAPTGAMSATAPELSLIGATAVPLDAAHAVVVGWYGPLCDAGTPTFAMTGMSYPRCEFTTANSRSFTIDGTTGRAITTATRLRHAFGAGARLSDGSGIVTGGIGDLGLHTNNGTEHFAATVSAGAAQETMVMPSMTTARAFHTMAPLEDGGAIVLGGVNFNTTGGVPSVGLLSAPEVIYLPRVATM